MKKMVEFGPDRRLNGVLTGAPAAPSSPTLILPSAGLQPRSGPFRLHVEMADRLAARGIRCFRFDVPGVGEAPRLNGYDAHAATLAAMDALETHHGCANFVIGGICSAADLGWNVAVSDARVSGVLLLDGMSYTGPWYHYARTIDRLRRLPREWRRMLRDAGRQHGGDGLGSADFRDWLSRAEARVQFSQLVARNANLLWIYTGGYTDRFLHPRQFRWTFGKPARSPRVAMHYWPDVDHTYFARAHRDRLIGTVDEWMVSLRQQSGMPS